MQAQPIVSPDGRFWWDGQTWQPMPGAPAPVVAAAAAPPPDPSRPGWLAEGQTLPGPPPAAPPPNAPVAYVEPEIPRWAEPAPRRHTITTISLWFGIVLGALVLIFGLLGIAAANAAPPAQQRNELTGALLFLVVGAVIFFPTFLNLTGYGQIISASSGLVGELINELGIVGVIVMALMIINTIIVLTQPVGGGRYVLPWATILIVGRRLWQGRWLAAGVIAGTWVVGILIAYLSAP